MKPFIFLMCSLLLFTAVQSQTIADVKKDMYYERFSSAEKKLTAMVNQPGPEPDAIYWLGEIYLDEGRIDAAYKLYNDKAGTMLQEIYNKKKSPLVYIGWAHVLLDTNRVAEGKTLMKAVLKETKFKNTEALQAVAKANMNSKAGDVKYGIELLDMAVKKDKKNPDLYNLLGNAYRKIQDGSNAVVNHHLALEADPSNAEALYKEGKIYKTQNNPEIYMEKFRQSYALDSIYAPVLYELYQYYFSRDVYYAQLYFNKFLQNSDPDPQHNYMAADLEYVSKKYADAIIKANAILRSEADSAQPRLYKLIAYSHAALGDSAAAFNAINLYFDKQDSTEYVAKDFALKAQLMEKQSTDTNAILLTYTKALSLEKENTNKIDYLNRLIRLASVADSSGLEADYRGQLYNTKPNASNLDLYKWGLALYQSKDFAKADSVFAIYQDKYPDQIYGYLYRAKSNTYVDSAMEKGLAVPHYKKLVEFAAKDEVKNKKILLMAYEYLAAYEANITKSYATSLEYFDKLLDLDPENADAAKNTQVIQKWMDEAKDND